MCVCAVSQSPIFHPIWTQTLREHIMPRKFEQNTSPPLTHPLLCICRKIFPVCSEATKIRTFERVLSGLSGPRTNGFRAPQNAKSNEKLAKKRLRSPEIAEQVMSPCITCKGCASATACSGCTCHAPSAKTTLFHSKKTQTRSTTCCTSMSVVGREECML